MEDTLPQSPYKILGVPKDATLATIRSAHRKLVLQCHPDKVQDESEKKVKAEQFHFVQQAYEILSDDSRRQRYDEKVKLAELRAEVGQDRGPPPRSRPAEYTSSRTTYSAGFEVRGDRLYETRAPNPSRAYQEDAFAANFADFRPSARKYDAMFADNTPRRTSGRMQDEKRRMREADLERERKSKETARKQEEAMLREQRDRRRARDKKRDMEAKSRRQFGYGDDDDSDSEVDLRRRREATPPKRRFEDSRRRDLDEPKRSVKRDARDHHDSDDMHSKVYAAENHIYRRKEEAREVEIEPRDRRTGRARASSDVPPAAPFPPSSRPAEPNRRSSDRERSDKERSGGEKERRRGRPSKPPSPVRTSSGKKNKQYEIVDPEPARKPPLASFTSDPKGLKTAPGLTKKEPLRSATYQTTRDFPHPGLPRSATLPITPKTRMDTQPLKSSNLRNAKDLSDDSDSDSDTSTESDSVPEYKPRPAASTKYSYKVMNNESSPQPIHAEPEEMDPRHREVSPKTRRTAERPPMAREGSSAMRTPPIRGNSFAKQDERTSSRRTDSGRMPPLNTHSSSRGPDKLFGEFSGPDDAFLRSPQSPRASPSDGRGSRTHARRTSEEVDRDAYAYAHGKSHRKPSYQRGESLYAGAV